MSIDANNFLQNTYRRSTERVCSVHLLVMAVMDLLLVTVCSVLRDTINCSITTATGIYMHIVYTDSLRAFAMSFQVSSVWWDFLY